MQFLQAIPMLVGIAARKVIPSGATVIQEKHIPCENPVREHECDGIFCMTRCMQNLHGYVGGLEFLTFFNP